LFVAGVVAPTIGEVINDVRSILTNKKRDEEGLAERYVNNVFTTLSLGLVDDAGTLITGKYGAGGTIGAIGGPTSSDVFAGIQAGQNLTKDRKTLTGKDEFVARTKPLARFAIKKIPVFGQTLSNTLIPNDYINTYAGTNRQSSNEAGIQKVEKAVSEENTQAEQLLKKALSSDNPTQVLKDAKDAGKLTKGGYDYVVKPAKMAKIIWETAEGKTETEQSTYLRKLKDQGILTQDLYKKVLDERTASQDASGLRGKSNAVKSRFVAQKLTEMQTDEERRIYLKGLLDNKSISREVYLEAYKLYKQ